MLASETPSDPTPRVLIVDDNVDAADSLAALLGIYGYVAYVAYSGLEALAVGEVVQPQFVILDIAMPRMDGYEAARQMRERPWGRQARLVALTAWDDDDTRRSARQAGMELYFAKPVVFDELMGILARRNAHPPPAVLS